MKLTVYELEAAQRAIKSRVLRPERILLEIEHIFGYINKLNRELERNQEVYEGKELKNMLFPSGLASLIEPRVIRYDINMLNSANLKASWPEDLKDEFEDREVTLSLSERQALLNDSSKGYTKLEDVPETDVKSVLTNKCRRSKEVKCPQGYGYNEFLADWQKICTQLRVSGERNVDLASAIADVNLMTIIDKVVIDGMVNYTGKYQDAFIPYFLTGFNLGMDTTGYNYRYKDMISDLFSERAVELFTK